MSEKHENGFSQERELPNRRDIFFQEYTKQGITVDTVTTLLDRVRRIQTNHKDVAAEYIEQEKGAIILEISS